MPTTYTKPAKIVNRCSPCSYHKAVNAFYGSDTSWCDYNCMHPEAYDDIKDEKSLGDPVKEKLRQDIIGSLLTEGRNIGKTEEQPPWCPLNREEKA